jgi:hypothetical protein
VGVCVGPQNVRKFDSIGKFPEGNCLIGPKMPIDVGSLFSCLLLVACCVWLNSQGRPFFAFSWGFRFPSCCPGWAGRAGWVDLIMLPAASYLHTSQ